MSALVLSTLILQFIAKTFHKFKIEDMKKLLESYC